MGIGREYGADEIISPSARNMQHSWGSFHEALVQVYTELQEYHDPDDVPLDDIRQMLNRSVARQIIIEDDAIKVFFSLFCVPQGRITAARSQL